MPNSETLNSLTAKVRQRSDQINSQTFDDTSELKVWIRGSLAQLYDMLCLRSGDYYTTCRPLSLIAGQEAYALPSDFKNLTDVFVLYAGGKNRLQLKPFSAEEFGQLGDLTVPLVPLAYRLMRNLLYVQPIPVADYYNAIEIHYVPQYRAPLLDYSSIDEVMPNGWDEWVVLDVLQKMSVKARLLNMDDIIKSKLALEQRLLQSASIRDAYAPVMRDATVHRPSPLTLGPPTGPIYWSIP
jgi:hypothetical protein